mmetsp:Transcript_125490/g.250417  ORF Transcript_125490/g.250417 Transcript_125490/m.250417 type:complete len:282 (+) Transcript_125490:199-1044(+)
MHKGPKRNPQRPYVCTASIMPNVSCLTHFRRIKIVSALSAVDRKVICHYLGHAIICNLDAAFFVHQQVLWFDISVRYPQGAAMQIFETLQRVTDVASCPFLRQKCLTIWSNIAVTVRVPVHGSTMRSVFQHQVKLSLRSRLFIKYSIQANTTRVIQKFHELHLIIDPVESCANLHSSFFHVPNEVSLPAQNQLLENFQSICLATATFLLATLHFRKSSVTQQRTDTVPIDCFRAVWMPHFVNLGQLHDLRSHGVHLASQRSAAAAHNWRQGTGNGLKKIGP